MDRLIGSLPGFTSPRSVASRAKGPGGRAAMRGRSDMARDHKGRASKEKGRQLALAPQSVQGGNVSLVVNRFTMQVDIETLAFHFRRDAQADNEVDHLQDDEGDD